MTIPAEERNAIVYTREFLCRLLDPQQTPRVPRAQRRAAAACLRHYPGPHKADELYACEIRRFEDMMGRAQRRALKGRKDAIRTK